MKRIFHRTLLRLERIADRFQRKQKATRVLEGYAGYASEEHLVIRGRVLTKLKGQTASEDAGIITNFRQMLSLFLTDEVADVRVYAGDVEALTDEEGYFTLLLPKPETSGWVDIPVHIDGFEDATICSAFIAPSAAEFMVISDIDDTVMETGAYSLARNLWTSLTGNALTRHIYADAVTLISDLSKGGQNPIFYVSSSPWNLYGFLNDIFERNALVRGPMFLRDLGLSETKLITDGHGNHKGGSIDLLIRAHPDLPVVLMGDTGQKDAEIYAGIVNSHPGRVAAVVLRETRNGSDDSDLGSIAKIEAANVPVFHNMQFPTEENIRSALAESGPDRIAENHR